MSDSRTRAHPILVVEDVVEMRELLLRLLRVLGYGPIAAGVTDYLLKPFTLATLESKLNRALAAPHAAGAPPHSP
ncbi:hypothetical protein [Inhella gelatinilytica]|uniref:Response regulatory domain-containing protein n=1 Tax=Inhella gelatinilytica TaxID=2795030 RepID=A0A931NCP5_9BURK|nr:hypothetical protein [Inhella gelatinilytica]MBH9551465.1 hypothetical protein [Inhella gelatinilytica]